MNRNRIPMITVVVLLLLLAVLATLQYRWLGQISNIESVRLSKRLDDDTRRFAADFNGEIQKAYYSFQIDADDLASNDLLLIKRYEFFKRQTEFPDLVKNLFYVRGKDERLSRLDRDKAAFLPAEWPAELLETRKALGSKDDLERVVNDSLLLPLYKKGPDVTKIILTRRSGKDDQVDQERHIELPEKDGFIIIELDRNVIEKKLLPALREKYFAQSGGGVFDVSVIDGQSKTVYTTTGERFLTGDASSSLLSLSPDEFAFFARDIGSSQRDGETVTNERVARNESFAMRTVRKVGNEVVSVETKGPETDNQFVSIADGETPRRAGEWKMYVRHTSGSLEGFVQSTRLRNLAVSFGILGILAAGMVLIVISTQRARALAQRQIEFVSSVSHEFRTPLAVIFAAGENISDGVVETSEKLAEYGALIKKEGRKLSAMVEQILEYAGAKSGNRKYDFKPVEISAVIEEILEEYEPLIRENGFVLERDIANDLPMVSADADGLRQALRNLVANALKYCDRDKWLRVSARNTNGEVRISVKDRGIGVSKDDQRKIFEPFYRAKRVVDQQISGNGLGLSLVKRIIEAHGGSVFLTSEPGGGAEFTIIIPAAGTK